MYHTVTTFTGKVDESDLSMADTSWTMIHVLIDPSKTLYIRADS